MTVHTCAHSKMQQHNIVNNVKLFSHGIGFKTSVCASTVDNRCNHLTQSNYITKIVNDAQYKFLKDIQYT